MRGGVLVADVKENAKVWQHELNEYIRQGEPEAQEKSRAWQTAIGLQAVDGLQTSEYLLDTDKEHIEGRITINEADQRIKSYYEQKDVRKSIENSTLGEYREADIVSVRIAELLGEKAFQFSPVELKNIHKHLFAGVFAHAGQYRDYNITKKEWVLSGDTVIYASATSLEDTLAYDFQQEKEFSYAKVAKADDAQKQLVKHIAKFTAGIWQIHPFCEGNTRTTAVFIIKYLRTFGFKVNNDVFAQHSWYFRNALVRANYTNWEKNIHETTKYLEKFFANLLLGEQHELKNRYLHVEYKK